MSLKESTIWKAWVGWEEGLRLAHRQQEIGEATTRMETKGDQLILMLRLSKGEHEWLETWRGDIWNYLMGLKKTRWTGESLDRMPEDAICM